MTNTQTDHTTPSVVIVCICAIKIKIFLSDGLGSKMESLYMLLQFLSVCHRIFNITLSFL